MALFNGQTSASGVVTPFSAKSITLTNTAGPPTDPITITAGVSAADDMAISVDSGVGGAGPTGAGTSVSPYVMNVQSLTIFAKNWRLDIAYNTPNPDATPASVSFYA